MATTTFPGAPSFADATIPPMPTLKEGESAQAYVERLAPALTGLQLAIMDMQGSIADGWLIEGLRVIDLEAVTITADSIFTQDLYIGSDGNGSIGLLGTQTLIKVVDEAGQTRIEIGDFGASNSDWGIKVTDSAGTVRFQSTSSTFINGAVITDATIDNAKITDLAGNKLTGSGFIDTAQLASLAVTNAKIGNLAVDTGQIASLAVETAKINNLAVDTAQLDDLAVDQAKRTVSTGGTATYNNVTIDGQVGEERTEEIEHGLDDRPVASVRCSASSDPGDPTLGFQMSSFFKTLNSTHVTGAVQVCSLGGTGDGNLTNISIQVVYW